jgi:hypothetical protein
MRRTVYSHLDVCDIERALLEDIYNREELVMMSFYLACYL